MFSRPLSDCPTMTWVLWCFFLVLRLCVINTAAESPTVTKNYIYHAGRKSNVQLPCNHPFPAPRIVTIQWYSGPDVILNVDSSGVKDDYETPLKGRIQFTGNDSSIRIDDPRSSDAGIYKCTVSSLNESFVAAVRLTFRDDWMDVVCTVEGEPVAGNAVTLGCRSMYVTKTTYTWTKISGNRMSDANAEATSGQKLIMDQITEDNCGRYRCTAKRHYVPSSPDGHHETQNCDIILECPSSPTTTTRDGDDGVPVPVVAVTTVMLALAVFCALAAAWYWSRRHRGELIIDDTMEVSSMWSREVEAFGDQGEVNWDGPGLEKLQCLDPPISGDTAVSSAK
uniref:cell surface A33 antigen-like n=1 Tax=Doryrhamphus excisus TaxID=161450 RepID=UPI0025ADD68A|nr:cell surface A33 antigen-like [Doryrhamphus excisus]